jgi:hypothetical protein
MRQNMILILTLNLIINHIFNHSLSCSNFYQSILFQQLMILVGLQQIKHEFLTLLEPLCQDMIMEIKNIIVVVCLLYLSHGE